MEKLFDVFISYSSKDKVKADAICAHFESRGMRCWYAPRDIKPGAEWAEAIIEALEQSQLLVLVFTGNANASQQVLREVSTAVSAGMPIVPIKFSEEEPSHSMKYYLATVHWMDAINEKQERAIKFLGDRCELLLKTGRQNLIEESIEEEPEKKGSGFKLFAILLVLGLVIVGGAVYFSMTNNISPASDSQTKADSIIHNNAEDSTETESETQVDIFKQIEKAQNKIAVKSWEQLENLTDEECENVYELIIIGNSVISPLDYSYYGWEWVGDEVLVEVRGQEDKILAENVGKGTVDNLEPILRCSNLEKLILTFQPIQSLEGISKLKQLKELDITQCDSVKDITEVFECSSLEKVHVNDTRVALLDGIGALKHLRELDVGGSYVKDLTPLEEIDYTYANEHNGFTLSINTDRNIDYTPLEKIEEFGFLGVDWAEYGTWWPHIKASQMNGLQAQGTGLDNDRLKEIVERFPEIERLSINQNPEVTDVSVLNDCPYLRELRLSGDMTDAIASAEQLKGIEIWID